MRIMDDFSPSVIPVTIYQDVCSDDGPRLFSQYTKIRLRGGPTYVSFQIGAAVRVS